MKINDKLFSQIFTSTLVREIDIKQIIVQSLYGHMIIHNKDIYEAGYLSGRQ